MSINISLHRSVEIKLYYEAQQILQSCTLKVYFCLFVRVWIKEVIFIQKITRVAERLYSLNCSGWLPGYQIPICSALFKASAMAIYTCEKGRCLYKELCAFFLTFSPVLWKRRRRPIIRLYTVLKLQSFSNKASPLQSHIKAAEKHKPRSAADSFLCWGNMSAITA